MRRRGTAGSRGRERPGRQARSIGGPARLLSEIGEGTDAMVDVILRAVITVDYRLVTHVTTTKYSRLSQHPPSLPPRSEKAAWLGATGCLRRKVRGAKKDPHPTPHVCCCDGWTGTPQSSCEGGSETNPRTLCSVSSAPSRGVYRDGPPLLWWEGPVTTPLRLPAPLSPQEA